MEEMIRSVRWFVLFQKRMLKKKGFLAILCIIPLFLSGAEQMAKQDSGVLRIALCKEEKEDAFAESIIQNLMKQSEVIHYIPVESEAEGVKMVQNRDADALWILPENTKAVIEAYASGRLQKNGWIRVIEQEENVILQMSRELLYGELYDSISYALYRSYLTQRVLVGERVEETILRDAYKEIDVSDNIFIYNQAEENVDFKQQSYLLMPIRGMLSLVILLVGLTVSLYYIQDVEQGCFTWLFAAYTPIRVWLYQLPALLDVTVVVMAGMAMVGIFAEWKKECLLMGLYLWMVMGFCDVLRRICRRISILGLLIPILMLISLALCPIFVKISSMKPLQVLLPPYHYLNAWNNGYYVKSMLGYVFAVFWLDLILFWGSGEKRRSLYRHLCFWKN